MANGCDNKSAAKEDSIDEKELERLAVESLLFEAKRGKLRAESFGASGWQKCPIPRPNKRFLNTLVSDAVSSNKRMKIQQLRREQSEVGGRPDTSPSDLKRLPKSLGKDTNTPSDSRRNARQWKDSSPVRPTCSDGVKDSDRA